MGNPLHRRRLHRPLQSLSHRHLHRPTHPKPSPSPPTPHHPHPLDLDRHLHRHRTNPPLRKPSPHHPHHATPPLHPPCHPTRSPLRSELEIDPTDTPVLLLAGDGHSARHDFGLWAATILSQLFPNTRAILREDPRYTRGTGDPGLNRFLNNLPNDRLIAIAPATTPWPDLLAIADIMLLTPSITTPTGPLLHALAANVPILATPVPCITEIIHDGTNGLLSATPPPRAIAAKLEEFMNDPTLRQTITQGVRAWTSTQPTPTQFIEALTAIYEPTPTLATAS